MRVSPLTAAAKWRNKARLIALQFDRHRLQVQTAASVTGALRSAPGRPDPATDSTSWRLGAVKRTSSLRMSVVCLADAIDRHPPIDRGRNGSVNQPRNLAAPKRPSRSLSPTLRRRTGQEPRLGRLVDPRIQQGDSREFVVTGIAGHDRQPMLQGRCGNDAEVRHQIAFRGDFGAPESMKSRA